MPTGRAALAAPLFLAALGCGMFMLATTQPAWLGDRIGPGLFARWLSLGVVALSLVWCAVEAFGRRRDAATASVRGNVGPSAGLALLAGVAAFALCFPVTGLVAACALTTGVAGFGAGVRRIVDVLVNMGLGGACA
ncbi:MAG: tripartite tricarboxylate transporter TctB family protein, partial [Pseudomonadota bacterium]